MPSNLLAMASNLGTMASNLRAMAAILLAMASRGSRQNLENKQRLQADMFEKTCFVEAERSESGNC